MGEICEGGRGRRRQAGKSCLLICYIYKNGKVEFEDEDRCFICKNVRDVCVLLVQIEDHSAELNCTDSMTVSIQCVQKQSRVIVLHTN
jgi:hypothetical protein